MTDKIEKAPATAARGYIGSIRFFKNLIFLSICVLIAVPSALAVKYYRAATALQTPERAAASEEAVPALAPTAEAAEITEENAAEEIFPAKISLIPAPSDDPPSYQALYPDFYAPQPYGATKRDEGTAYLTFDDGPSPRTDEILKILAEQDVKATFFVVGCNEEGDEQRLRDIVAQGHTIGMHSYSHDYGKVYASVEDFLAEFYANFTQIRDATGVAPTVFRCPGGSINGYDSGFYQEIFSEMMRRGFVPFDWNVSSEDAAGGRKTAAELAENVSRQMAGKVRAIVLFHDSAVKFSTVASLPAVIERAREQGFQLAAITPETMPVIFPYN